MDIWEPLYHPEAVNEFIYAHNVACALQSKSDQIFTGFCIKGLSGTLNLCAERVALLNMYTTSGETEVQRLIAFRDAPPTGISGMPCGVCRETLSQFSPNNRHTQIMADYATRRTVTLDGLLPDWWGDIKTS